MKKIPQILFCIFPYLFAVNAWIFTERNSEKNVSVLCTWLPSIILGMIILLNIVNMAIMCKKQEAFRKMAFWNLIIKLAHIPFYVIVFFIGILCGLLGLIPIPFMIFVSLGSVIILVIMDYMMLLLSSIYGIAAINIGKNKGILLEKELIWYSILHFIFLGDVIIAAILYGRARKCVCK